MWFWQVAGGNVGCSSAVLEGDGALGGCGLGG